jgi:hypothetical protein
MLDPICLDLAVHQVQAGVGLTCMPHPICLDLTISQVQDRVGLSRMSDLMHLDLAVCQVQSGVGLTCVPDPICLDLAHCQVQSDMGLARMSHPIRLDLAVRWIWISWVKHAFNNCSWMYWNSPKRLRMMDYCNEIECFINYASSNLRNISGGNIKCSCMRCKKKKYSIQML